MRRDDTLWTWSALGSDRAGGPFASAEEALADARDSDEVRVLLGHVEYLDPADYAFVVDADDLCERMAEAAHDTDGWDDPEIDVRKRPTTGTDAQEQLELALETWAHEWLSSTDWRMADGAVETDVPATEKAP